MLSEFQVGKLIAIIYLTNGLLCLALPRLCSNLRVSLWTGKWLRPIGLSISIAICVMIIRYHNVWVWDIPLIITLAGWVGVVKCILFLVIPSLQSFILEAEALDSAVENVLAFRLGGLLCLFSGGLIWWHYVLR